MLATGPAPVNAGPSTSTAGTVTSVRTPDSTSVTPSRSRGSRWSASRPPSQVPAEIPARIVPMIAVYVCRVVPT